ncbi:MAG: energy transducer TonB, partial [Rhodobacteraceae bacterium]|nr:energy transducer TonB [Paracoccaceae bacterium]
GTVPVAGARGAEVAAPGAGNAGAGALSEGARAALLADWAGAIRARVERRKAYPRAARAARATGTVLLRMTVAADGTLLSAGVAQPSGHAALDRAALEALSGAGRLPAAPAGLDRARQVFTLPLRFAP